MEEKKMELVPEEKKEETAPKTETPAEEKEGALKKFWKGAKKVGKKVALPAAIGGGCILGYIFGEKTGLNKALKTLKPAEDPCEDDENSYDEDDDNDDEDSEEEDEE